MAIKIKNTIVIDDSENWLGKPVPVDKGGTGATNAVDARTNLGGTTVGQNLFTLPNSDETRFPRLNADNTVSALLASDFLTAIGIAPLILSEENLLSNTTIPSSNLVLTKGTTSIPSSVSLTVEENAQIVITGNSKSILQFDATTSAWSTTEGPVGKIIGDSDVQTLKNKTFEAPQINNPEIDGGRITNCEIILSAAIWHSHTVNTAVSIPENCNALSILPINILSGGIVSVGPNTTWSFLEF